MKRLYMILAAAAALMATGCNKDLPDTPDPDAPRLEGTILANISSTETGNRADVIFTFDQNVRCTADARTRISAGKASVEAVNAYDTKVTVSLSGLESGVNYTVEIPAGVVSGFRDNPCGRMTYSFSMTFLQPDTEYDINVVPQLTDPKASPEANVLYRFLLDSYGKTMISGLQSEIGNHKEGSFAAAIKSDTGKYPAIQGFDYLFQQWGETNWCSIAEITRAAEEHWNNGGIVAMSWHWNVPNSKENAQDPARYNFYLRDDSGNALCTFDIREALKEGTWQNEFLMNDIGKLAGNLRQLADKGIPVLWRPLHEAAGDYTWGAWFWWGAKGPEYTSQLWKLLYTQLTEVYGLHNLIWVWTFQTSDAGKLASRSRIAETYPGDEFVDIVGVDLYEGSRSLFSRPDVFRRVNNVVKGRKMLALTECGNLPDPDRCFREKDADPWAWFMSWTDEGYGQWNSAALWKSVMNSPKVVTRENMKSLK